MKTIKIIDLLNKIANEEEVPEKINYNGTLYSYDEGIDYKNQYNGFLMGGRVCICPADLNDTVEIIKPQEHKIPEKLESYISCGWVGTCKDLKREDLFNDLEKIGSKINEIIGYLEEIE